MLFQFKIQLNDIHNPTVWRRVTLPNNFSFYKFHKVIQAAFGWGDYHLFQFSPKGYGSSPIISIPDSENDSMDDMEKLNAKKIKLKTYSPQKNKNICISTILATTGNTR